ncbi:MAG: Asd/ArgC dimerization domain-containing protein [Actinomyces sp.]|uniref:Asd/ArgC dimerization domain-containing protein n=1 Tax=uncultured Actinomyces sp. TaxID=249061 RepID=UPI0028047AEB|nr:Asd/ArgC dimerization domain-containing protein [uncultured Actinomyces sp.]MDU4832521.1 Asd/ArgC dimerization domain-containing protein [Actinomyces sp.]
MSVSVGIVGASGFAGSEIARILSEHPHCDVRVLVAASSAGTRFGDLNPHIPALADKIIQPFEVDALSSLDLVFVALPHGKSAEITSALEGGPVVIDAGADHRLKSKESWQQFYGGPHMRAWDYAMPELVHADEADAILSGKQKKADTQRKILKNSRAVAVPGCNVTAVTLAMMPAVAAGFVSSGSLVATLAVGYSGAGRSAKPHLMATSALSNIAPYSAVGKHRHIPEIVQNLQVCGAGEIEVEMTPVLVPTSRGIVAVVNAATDGVSTSELQEAYSAVYGAEKLIDLSPAYPQSGPVVGTGRAQVWAGVNPNTGVLTAMTAIDNLGKGTAAAAVQAANLAFGFDECLGIYMNGVL